MSMPEFAMTYVVYWPEAGVLKVGRAWRFHRVQMMTRSGGQIIVLARGTDATWEAEALRVLRRWFPSAFRDEVEARELLFMGRGWTECFTVDEHHLQLAVDLVFEGFARGNEQGVNEATDDQREASDLDGLPESAGRGEADGARTVGAHGRGRSAGAGTGADRGRSVSGESGDADGRGAPAAAGRVGVSDDLRGGRVALDPAAAPAGRGPSRSALGLPAATGPGISTDIRGCGGSAGAGGGAGACRAGRAGERVGVVGRRARAGTPTTSPTSAAGCPAHRMPRAPGRTIRGLRTLRHRPPPARQVGPAGALHAEPHRPRDRTRDGAVR